MGKKKLLVEGKNDGIVICELCHRHNINANKLEPKRVLSPNEIACKSVDGIEELWKQLPVELKESDLEVMGVVVDADTDLVTRWESLRDRLRKSGYSTLPEAPGQGGTILEEGDLPRLGLWVMPDNQLSGMIEDFVAFLVPQNDFLWPYAQECVDSIEKENRPFGIHIAKAKIHTWLAWREVPGTPMGSAIKRRYLEADVPQALAFIEWIKELFKV